MEGIPMTVPEQPGSKRRARKRADGEGSIRYSESKKLWIGRLMVGYRPDGKPDRFCCSGMGRPFEAIIRPRCEACGPPPAPWEGRWGRAGEAGPDGLPTMGPLGCNRTDSSAGNRQVAPV